ADKLPLLTECIGYGSRDIRVPDQTRAALLDQFHHLRVSLNRAEIESGHELLADHYEELDGVTRITGLDCARSVAWMEKIHHLAHGGVPTERRWQQQEPFAREFYWARARWLSR